MQENKTCIMVDFWIVGDNFDINMVNDKLKVKPTETRQKNEFKLSSFAKTEWSVSTGYQDSVEVAEQLQAIINLLYDKEQIIKAILNEHNLECGFNIVIKEYEESVIIELLREHIQFAANINAQINFDIYK